MTSIESRLRSIESKRNRLMVTLASDAPAVVAARPTPGKWSVLEIVEHLVLSEAGVFGDLNALRERVPQARTLMDRLRYLVVMFVLRFDIPVRVPSAAMVPRGGVSLDELQVRWEQNHARLREWIVSSESTELARPRFIHPIAGPMTTTESLRMLEVHLDRHLRQIGALRSRAIPAATGLP